jgi:GGDEF domain-containing protein
MIAEMAAVVPMLDIDHIKPINDRLNTPGASLSGGR